MKRSDYSTFGSGRMYCDMPDWINQYETEFQSDCSRLIYSPSFRRLQGKTQLYPNGEYDYFRSRLTHSLEVNEIAQRIGARINRQIQKIRKRDDGFFVSPDVLRFACLAHDLGHPPFGHDGERQLDVCMGEEGFDGNAQTFRILTRLEKGCINSIKNSGKDGERTGLNITFRSLASVLKHYNNKKESPKNGYYSSEADIVQTIFRELGHPVSDEQMRTLECQIMDFADDISNAVHDLDDSLKGNLLNPFDLFMPQEDILEKVAIRVCHKDEGDHYDYKNKPNERKEDYKRIYRQLNWIFNESGFIDFSLPKGEDIMDAISPIYKKMRSLMSDGSKRSLFISNLRNKFINSLAIEYDEKAPLFSKLIYLKGSQEDDDPQLQVDILKSFHHFYQCHSFYIEARAFRGHYIVKQLFDAVRSDTRLMPDDYYARLTQYGPDNERRGPFKPEQLRCICDFIAGMTDRYCLEFYGRLFSENPQSIFKPL